MGERSFLPTPALARVTMSTFDNRSVSGRRAGACGLFLRAVDYFNVETGAGENVTTLIEALPDTRLSHATDDRCR